MMISADLRMSIGLTANLRAMVAVIVASTLAFTPLPNPSVRTDTMRPSSFTFSVRKTSPEINWPMKFSSGAFMSTFRRRPHPALRG